MLLANLNVYILLTQEHDRTEISSVQLAFDQAVQQFAMITAKDIGLDYAVQVWINGKLTSLMTYDQFSRLYQDT